MREEFRRNARAVVSNPKLDVLAGAGDGYDVCVRHIALALANDEMLEARLRRER